jgi:serine protease Do
MTVLALTCSVVGLARAQTPPTERAPRTYLGVYAEPTGGAPGRAGVVVGGVAPDSPAARAGLKTGDEIVRVGDRDVKTLDDLENAMASHKAGDKLAFQVRRDGKEENMTVTLGDRPPEGRAMGPGLRQRRGGPVLGVATSDLTPDRKQNLGVSADTGAVVNDILPGSPAEQAGIRRGDVITRIGDRDIRGPQDLQEAVRQAGVGKEVPIKVVRGQETKEVQAKLGEPRGGDMMRPPFMESGGMLPDMQGPLQRIERRLEELDRRLNNLEQKINQRPSRE